MNAKRQFKAKFTGKCDVCGHQVLGWKAGHPTVSYEHAHYYQWRKRDASGSTVSGRIMHVDPTCAEVAAGILLPSDMRDGATPAPNPEADEPIITPKHVPSARPVATAPVAPVASVTVPVAVPDNEPPAPVTPITPKGKTKLVGAVTWDKLFPALLDAGVRRLGLTGPAGTGKSTTAAILAAKLSGRKVYRVTMTEHTTLEDLLGSFQLVKEDGVTVQKFVKGPVPLAMEEGAVLQFDEFTHTQGEVESLMYGVWDDQPQVLLADGTYIDKTAPGFACIGTTNDAPEQLAPPLLDRCEAFLLATTPHPAALAGCTPEEVAVCQNHYNGLDNRPWKFSRPASVRMVRAFSRLRKTGLISDELLAGAIFGEAGKEFLSALSTAALTAKRAATEKTQLAHLRMTHCPHCSRLLQFADKTNNRCPNCRKPLC